MTRTVRLLPAGRQFAVEDDESVLDAALRQGLLLPYGCRNGACGTCRARVISGRVRYPGEAGTDDGEEALLCQARAASDLALEVHEVQTSEAFAARRYAARVSRLERLAGDVMLVGLALPRDERMAFVAGQYLEVITRDGHRRAFSLANPPHHDEALELHVRFVAGGEFTEHVFSGMRLGEVVQIDGPHGAFRLREESATPALMIAGGTGFAPLKAQLEHAIHLGLARSVHLYWGARGRDDLYLAALPNRWARELPWFSYTPVLSEADSEWVGCRGLVHEAALADHPAPGGLEVYAAGPPAMVAAARDAFLACGLDGADFISDPFEFGAPRDAVQ